LFASLRSAANLYGIFGENEKDLSIRAKEIFHMNQKGFANIALVIIIVILVGAAGYFTLIKKSSPITQETNTQSSIQTQQAAKSSTPTPKNETASWKTYTNSKYGIIFKYPPSLTIKEIDPVKSGETSAETGNLLWVNVGNNFTIEVLSKKPASPYDYIFEKYSKKQQVTFGASNKSLTTYLSFNMTKGECYGISTVRGSCKNYFAVPVQGQKYWYIFTGLLANKEITKDGLSILSSAGIEFFAQKEEPVLTTWGCKPVTQGMAPDPDNPPPTVCGYLPTCPNGQFLVISLGEGTWPDGSHKGGFSCSYNLPP